VIRERPRVGRVRVALAVLRRARKTVHMRVYIPASASDLAIQTSGQWEPAHAFAATDALAAAAPELDEDELAELAIDLAAEASALSLGSRLRVVIAADYSRADVALDPDAGPGAVILTGRLAPGAVACVFMDEEDAAADVAVAQGGDEDALERLGERSLLWYELGELS
jgi:hypothetical protein